MPHFIPADSITGLWELICFAGTILTTMFVWLCSWR